MAKQQPQGQSSGSESSLDFFWLIALIVVGGALAWYFGKDYIAPVVFTVRYYELIAVQFVLNIWATITTWLHLPTPDLAKVNELINLVSNKPAANISFNTITNISSNVGNYLRYFLSPILIGFAVLIYFSHVTAKFKNLFNMQRLKNIEHENWPQITPVVKLNLVKEGLDTGPWAMAMPPLQFIKKNNLAYEEQVADQISLTLIEGAAHRVFSLQLGPLWQGIENAPIHAQALFAIFACRANRDRESGDKLLLQIAASTNHGKLDFTGAEELVNKHKNSPLVKRITNKHAYLSTVMASMLELARTDGVLASAEFIWLKPVDRKLWYILNSVGRQTAFTESAGTFSHWMAEKTLQRPLKVPMVDAAVNALKIALTDILYEPEQN